MYVISIYLGIHTFFQTSSSHCVRGLRHNTQHGTCAPGMRWSLSWSENVDGLWCDIHGLKYNITM